jgi:hypothetical protein
MYIPFTFSAPSSTGNLIPNYSWSFYQTLAANRGVDVWYINQFGKYDGLTLFNDGPGTQTISGSVNSPFTPWIANVSTNFTTGGAPQITGVSGGAIYTIGSIVELTITLNSFSVYGNTRRYFNLKYTNGSGQQLTTGCFGGSSGLGGVGDAATQPNVKIMNPLSETIYTPKVDGSATGCGGSSGAFLFGLIPS